MPKKCFNSKTFTVDNVLIIERFCGYMFYE